eukprot:c6492_g1_i1.p1 GENE.c6492_g1_i1~~c6492_g1_i1.p1  ORF type:complete len:188 (-),score=51.30 c6492_g1_i1:49-612(-)
MGARTFCHAMTDSTTEKRKPIDNGDVLEKYRWTQRLPDLTVSVPVPAGTKSKMVEVVFGNQKLKVGLKGQPPIIDGELSGPIISSECAWTIEDGCLISLELTKLHKQGWWKNLMKGDPEIDTGKIEPENSKVEDLDPEAQQLVRKMMFDQRQKAAGLPTSDELQKQETLLKFQQQHPEFDFSNAKIS